MYVLSELFFYKILFVVEILFFMHLLSFRQTKKNHYVVRMVVSIVICLSLAVAFPIPPQFYNSFYTSIMFLILFAFCVVALFFVYRIPFKILIFISITAYTTQHFAHELFALVVQCLGMVTSPTLGLYGSQPIDFTKFDQNTVFYALIYMEIYLVVYWVIFAIIGKRFQKNKIIIENDSMVLIAAIVLLVDVILNAVIIYITGGYNKAYTIVGCIYNLLCCSMVLYIQFSLTKTKNLQLELQTTLRLLKQSEAQYKTSKENIELINLKCHDLKHQLREYAQKGHLDSEYLKELEGVIEIYDSTIQTNNEALDLILSEKSLICQKEKIKLTCLVDGEALTFISKPDLYSLFGNLLDNAIEAVSKISDFEKRHINLVVKKVSSFISISIDNYYEGNIYIQKNGLPQTTKDKDYHGYGMKSVQIIVQKYDGDLSIETKNQIFSLSILLPLPK